MRKSLFVYMVEDAKILYSSNAFFSVALEKLIARFKTLGGKRVWKVNAWYWILKPDIKPREVLMVLRFGSWARNQEGFESGLDLDVYFNPPTRILNGME